VAKVPEQSKSHRHWVRLMNNLYMKDFYIEDEFKIDDKYNANIEEILK